MKIESTLVKIEEHNRRVKELDSLIGTNPTDYFSKSSNPFTRIQYQVQERN